MDEDTMTEKSVEIQNGEDQKKLIDGCGERKTAAKESGSQSFKNKEIFFRADQIDLKSLDYQLEKHLNRVWSRNRDSERPKAEWEIDLSNLDVKNVIAQGAHGTVYKGIYDGRDVAVRWSFDGNLGTQDSFEKFFTSLS